MLIHLCDRAYVRAFRNKGFIVVKIYFRLVIIIVGLFIVC